MAAVASNKRFCTNRNTPCFGSESTHPNNDRISVETRTAGTLLDIAARVVAGNVPFQRVEQTYPRIPEIVLNRIVYWSFPRNERYIRMYSSFVAGTVGAGGGTKEDGESLGVPFDRGVRLLETGAVHNVLQIGFHLSGTVQELVSGLFPEQEKVYKVSVNFDRCKITSVKCGCESRDIFWCQHVVALSLYRIRKADSVQIRLPISETLLQMTREQLQKFSQYLISEHHTDVLPTAQRLADEILQSHSTINKLQGAPDPTAGGSVDDEYSWHLDEEQIQKLVKNFLTHGSHIEQLTSIFHKVREMLSASDSNSIRMLTLITEQFLLDPRLSGWRSSGIPTTDKCRPLWDEIGVLWVCVVLDPHCSSMEKNSWIQRLKSWSQLPVCPLEDGDTRPSDAGGGHPHTVFQRALDAVNMSWSDSHLQLILTENNSNVESRKNYRCRCTSSKHNPCKLINSSGQRIWIENIPMACSRVEALRSHGYIDEAKRLAVAIVLGMKHQQHQSCTSYHDRKTNLPLPAHTSGFSSSYHHYHHHHHHSHQRLSVPTASTEGWIGHPLDPIGCLFNTLLEAGATKYNNSSNSSEESIVSGSSTVLDMSLEVTEKPSSSAAGLTLNVVTSSCDNHLKEEYNCLALEVALMGLGQQRLMSPGVYAQEKAVKQEEKLISQLEEMNLIVDELLIHVFLEQVHKLLDSGSGSGLSHGAHPHSAPMHTFAKYLFISLMPIDCDLAFRVGLRAMRLPVLEVVDDHDEGHTNHQSSNPIISRYPRWFNFAHVETRQCDLAANMLYASRDDPPRLRSVLESAQRNIYSSRQLFKLAQDAYKRAIPETGALRHRPLLDTALELGLQVMRLTLNRSGWQRNEMVRWLVKCATELGFEALLSLMKNWYSFFTPQEATGTVASTITTPTTLVHLGLDFVRQEDLASRACTLAVQCVRKDAPNCALSALTLCEKNMHAFEDAYHHIVEAAPHSMNWTQLFALARYMERRSNAMRAHKMALLAMKNLHLAHNQDTHPAINDIHWSCALSHSIGKNELTSMILVVIENIHCATVLSDILRRCTLSAPSLNPSVGGGGGGGGKDRTNLVLLSYDKPPLHQLLNAALAAYVNTMHSRLAHISPRHYTDFIEFLSKARDTFMLAMDGRLQFAHLIDNTKLVYKGKKKLMLLITERFGL